MFVNPSTPDLVCFPKYNLYNGHAFLPALLRRILGLVTVRIQQLIHQLHITFLCLFRRDPLVNDLLPRFSLRFALSDSSKSVVADNIQSPHSG